MKFILIVEDRPVSGKLLHDFLKGKGFRVALAKNGQECIHFMLNQKPDLVLLDLKIPIIDGWEVARLAKSNTATRHIPIIATTAQALPGDKEKALSAGCDDYMTKPLNYEILLEKINEWLSR